MKVLVIGSGGREHSVVKKIKQSKKNIDIYCAPGNGGISDDAKCIDIAATDIDKIVGFSKENEIDLVCVTPDDPLYAGMVDALTKEGIRAFGPNSKAAVIEGSKAFSKNLMKKYNIPTPEYEVFDDAKKATEYLEKVDFPIVLKADGLALGKGVLICKDKKEALDGIKQIMIDKKFGEAGDRMIIEEFLTGQEVSILSFCDGNTFSLMPSSQDHKRALDNDKGLNTGGMGVFTPSKIYDDKMNKYCIDNIFKPTIEAMKAENRPFKGVLYFGLIITDKGPKVLEYNARFGDPETQVVLNLLETDLIDIFDACIDGRLDQIDIKWEDKASVCVILASGGYPIKYKKGYEINGLDKYKDSDEITIFHAGTKKENGRYYTNGGRVLGISATEANIDRAREKVYNAIENIDFKDKHFRRDIGIK